MNFYDYKPPLYDVSDDQTAHWCPVLVSYAAKTNEFGGPITSSGDPSSNIHRKYKINYLGSTTLFVNRFAYPNCNLQVTGIA